MRLAERLQMVSCWASLALAWLRLWSPSCPTGCPGEPWKARPSPCPQRSWPQLWRSQAGLTPVRCSVWKWWNRALPGRAPGVQLRLCLPPCPLPCTARHFRVQCSLHSSRYDPAKGPLEGSQRLSCYFLNSTGDSGWSEAHQTQ